jgi:hypothetical protein
LATISDSLTAALSCNRRQFMSRAGLGLGALAMSQLSAAERAARASLLASSETHRSPKVKRVIYLFQSGAPSQIDLFDYKPELAKHHGGNLPDSIRMGQRLTTMTAGQKSFPVAKSAFKFVQHGSHGIWLSELTPHTAKMADDLCFIRSMKTEAINHDPAITFCQTGSELAGRPSMGAWVAYGLGSMNNDLPSFVVLVSRGTGRPGDQPLYDRLWGSGFLPTKYQGVKFRSGKDPVLYLANTSGVSRPLRRQMLDDLASLNSVKHQDAGDPAILTRIDQYELAFRMQSSVPELTDISSEPQSVLEMYGPDVHRPGTYARNCLLARRLAERDVRFVQLYHMGWDQHFHLPYQIRKQCGDTDQPSAALVQDLKQRGLLDDTLIIWGGEFGRTVYSQGELTATDYGRDHHPRCFTIWMTGGGIKRGAVFGATDDFSYNVTENPVEVFDLNATILHLLGIDHERLTYRFQGRDFRLTDVHGRVLQELLT